MWAKKISQLGSSSRVWLAYVNLLHWWIGSTGNLREVSARWKSDFKSIKKILKSFFDDHTIIKMFSLLFDTVDVLILSLSIAQLGILSKVVSFTFVSFFFNLTLLL